MVQQIPRPGNFNQGYWYTNRQTGGGQSRGILANSIQRVYLDVWMAYWRQPNALGSIGGHDYDWEHFVVQLEYLPGVALVPLTLTIAQHATHYTLRWANWAGDANHFKKLPGNNPWGGGWGFPAAYVSQKGHGLCHTENPSSWGFDNFDAGGDYWWLPVKKNEELFQLNPNSTGPCRWDYPAGAKTIRYVYDTNLNWGAAGRNPYERVVSLGARGYYNFDTYKTQSEYSGAESYSLYKKEGSLGTIDRNECNNNQDYRVGCAYWSTSP